MATPQEYMWEWNGARSEVAFPRLPRSRRQETMKPPPTTTFYRDAEDHSEPSRDQLWRGHGKRMANGGGIHVVVCCCNEDEDELKVMLSTFNSNHQAPCRVRATFIVDSRNSGFYDAYSDTFVELRRLLPVNESGSKGEEKSEAGQSQDSYGEFGCMRESGVIPKSQVPFDIYVKGQSLPQGKRNSLVMFFEEILPAKITRGEAAEPEAVYILDADTGHLENGLDDVLRMFHLLMSEKETAACTCPVRPMSQFGSFLSASQALEYAQVWDCVGESFYAAQTTARGTSVMFKYACLVEDGRGAMPPIGEGAQPPALYMFSKSAGSLATTILLDVSPDDGMLVLLRQRAYDARSCAVADAVTCVPPSLLEFYAQRRRWYAASATTVLSSLTGRESYFKQERGRIFMALYTVVFNIYLHSGVVFLPVLLAKGISVIYSNWMFEEREGSTGGLEWIVFLVVWGFLLVNTVLYLFVSYKHLWLWIIVSSVLWMMTCGVVLVGVSVFGMYWIGPAVIIVPFLLGALNACDSDMERWAGMAISAVPFVLVSSVHMVLVLLFAVATVDSAEWGTRDVASFDSGVCENKANSMSWKKYMYTFWAVAGGMATGAMLLATSNFTFVPIVVGIPVVANGLKLVFSIIPGKLERKRQRLLVGEGRADRPLSLGLRRTTDQTSSTTLALESLPGDYRTTARTKSAVVSNCPTENDSYGTADDGTPSPSLSNQFAFSADSPSVAPVLKISPPTRGGRAGPHSRDPRGIGKNGSGNRSRSRSRSSSRSPSTSRHASSLTSGTSRMTNPRSGPLEGASINGDPGEEETPPRPLMSTVHSGLFSTEDTESGMDVDSVLVAANMRASDDPSPRAVKGVKMTTPDGACRESGDGGPDNIPQGVVEREVHSKADGEGGGETKPPGGKGDKDGSPVQSGPPAAPDDSARQTNVENARQSDSSPQGVEGGRPSDEDAGSPQAPAWRPPSIPRTSSSGTKMPSLPQQQTQARASDNRGSGGGGGGSAGGKGRKKASTAEGKRGLHRRESSADDSENERILAANTARNAASSVGLAVINQRTAPKANPFTGSRKSWNFGHGSDSEDDAPPAPVRQTIPAQNSSQGLYGRWGVGRESFDSDGDGDGDGHTHHVPGGRNAGMNVAPAGQANGRGNGNRPFGTGMLSGWGRRQSSIDESDDERMPPAVGNTGRNAENTAGRGVAGSKVTAAALIGTRSTWYNGESFESEDGENRRAPVPAQRTGAQVPGRGVAAAPVHARAPPAGRKPGAYTAWGETPMDSEDENYVPSPNLFARTSLGSGKGKFSRGASGSVKGTLAEGIRSGAPNDTGGTRSNGASWGVKGALAEGVRSGAPNNTDGRRSSSGSWGVKGTLAEDVRSGVPNDAGGRRSSSGSWTMTGTLAEGVRGGAPDNAGSTRSSSGSWGNAVLGAGNQVARTTSGWGSSILGSIGGNQVARSSVLGVGVGSSHVPNPTIAPVPSSSSRAASGPSVAAPVLVPAAVAAATVPARAAPVAPGGTGTDSHPRPAGGVQKVTPAGGERGVGDPAAVARTGQSAITLQKEPPTAPDRTWGAGQSSVFDSSGSEESGGERGGKPHSLRGVKILANANTSLAEGVAAARGDGNGGAQGGGIASAAHGRTGGDGDGR